MPSPELKRLADHIRRAASAQAWSQGAVLVRKDAVLVEDESPSEVVLRIRSPGRAIPFEAVLYPTDDEWECSCDGRSKACSHVAAAVIAVTQGSAPHATADDLPATPRVEYRFTSGGERVRLERRYSTGEPVVGSITAIVTGRVRGPDILVDQCDLEVDRILGTRQTAPVVADMAVRIIEHLAGCERVWVDDTHVEVDHDPIRPHGVIRDHGDGVILIISVDASVERRIGSGLCVTDDNHLAVLARTTLCGRDHEHLPIEKSYQQRELAELAIETLPALRRELDVTVDTDRLPNEVRLAPRIELNVDHRDGMLSVLPLLVYGNPPVARVDGGRLVHLGGGAPKRDVAGERAVALELRTNLDIIVGRRAEFHGPEAQQFLAKLHRWDRGGQVAPGLLTQADLNPQLMVDDDRFDVSFRSPDGRRAEATAVISAWRSGLDVVPLLGGGFAPIPKEWLAAHGHLVAELLDGRDEQGRLSLIKAPSLAQLCEHLEHPPPPSLERLRPLLDKQPAEFDAPANLGDILRPYQKTGVNWLAFLKATGLGAVLADDMGLGKTLQALAVVDGKTLVVCPRSVVHNWAAEAARFRPDLGVSIYHGARRELDDSADLVLTTYALLRNDIDELGARTWSTVILDEAQAIKNPDSLSARAAYRLDAEFRIAMTGTPVENRLEELWSLFHFAGRGLLGGRSDFRDRFGDPIGNGDSEAAARLRQRIAPFLLRRRKAEVATDLPPRTESVLSCELESSERAVYDAVHAASKEEIVELLSSGRGNVLKALEALLRLRQAACHPGLLPGRQADSSAKTARLLGALEEAVADGHKALVFSQWTSFLDLIEPHLIASDINFSRLDGSTRNRKEVVDGFQSDDGPPVMLVSLKAGGTGLNLTAADHVFLLDPWWNPAVEDQAADRAHRIGQDRPVMVYRLITVGTVEERILDLQAAKRQVADAALSGSGQIKGITKDDLLALIE